MDFSDVERSPYPRSQVFAAHRDDLEAVVANLAEVRRVELRSRSTGSGGEIEQLHHWFGSQAALPLLVRPFVREDLLMWAQRTVWDEPSYQARWTIEVPGIGNAVSCSGHHRYEADGSGTRIEVVGSFAFDPTGSPQLASVPHSAIPMVEKMVVSLIVPMIKRSGAAVSDYLKHRKLMSRGRDRHHAKAAALQALGKELSRRAGSACELCTGKQNPRPHLVPPPDEPSLETAALLCEPCRDMVDGGRLLDDDDLRYLETAIWADVVPVQIAAVRLLRRLAEGSSADWAIEALDGLWLPEEIESRL